MHRTFTIVVFLFSVVAARKAYVSSNRTDARIDDESVQQSIKKAVTYLLDQRQSDYGWGSSTATSRANVALAFAENVVPLNQDEKKLMKQQLDIQLSLGLISPKPILSHLALYVNAMHATCQDPHNFQGMDLVNRLRTETTKSMGSNFTLPFVLLTLCIANQSVYQDYQQLTTIYNSNSKISMQAISILAMVCVRQKNRNANMFDSYIRDFARKMPGLRDSDLDVYTKPLVMQAAAALNLNHKFELLRHQKKDGSFGDLLATYYSIPALLNSSLLDLKCKSSNSTKGKSMAFTLKLDDKKVTISVWIASDMKNTHSIVLTSKGHESLFDILKMAESRDSMYRFFYDETMVGKEVFSLAGVPNDPEKGTSWKIYEARSNSIINFSRANMIELPNAIDKIFPTDQSHFIFWFDSD